MGLIGGPLQVQSPPVWVEPVQTLSFPQGRLEDILYFAVQVEFVLKVLETLIYVSDRTNTTASRKITKCS